MIRRSPSPFLLLAIAFINLLLFLGCQYTFGVFFKPLAAEFGWSAATTSSTFSMIWLLQCLVYFFAGSLCNRFGPRLLIALAALTQGAGYVLMYTTQSVWDAYLYFAMVSVGISVGFVPAMAMVAGAASRHRALMTGIASSGAAVGTMIIPPVSNWLITSVGWRLSYVIVGSVLASVACLSTLFIPKHGSDENAVAIVVKRPGAHYFLALRTKRFWLMGGVMFCLGAYTNSLMAHIVPYLVDAGTTAAVAVNIFLVIGLLNALSRILVGSVSNKVGSRNSLVLCLVLSLFSLAALVPPSENAVFYLFATAFGFAFGAASVLHPIMMGELFDISIYWTAYGLSSSLYALGSAVGPVVVGWTYDATREYTAAFWLLVAIAVLGTFLAVALMLEGRLKKSRLPLILGDRASQ